MYINVNVKNHAVLTSPLWATVRRVSFISTAHLELQLVSGEIKRLTEIEKHSKRLTEKA